jgi:hypothetical protein
MAAYEPVCITYYDADTQTMRNCTVLRSHVQAAIDRASGISVPPDAEAFSEAPIKDEDARKLGGMIYLILAASYPELRARLQITTDSPMD